MKNLLIYLILIIVAAGCGNSESMPVEVSSTLSEFRTDTIPTIIIEGEHTGVRTSHEILTIRLIDSVVVKRLTQLNNFFNDAKLLTLTGYSSKDGLSDYLMDSIFYDSNRNDTLTKMYVKTKNKNWAYVQSIKRDFDEQNNLKHLLSERFVPKHKIVEEFYTYHNNRLKEQTTYWCDSSIPICDSTSKSIYFQDNNGNLDSIQLFNWENGKWIYYQKPKQDSTDKLYTFE